MSGLAKLAVLLALLSAVLPAAGALEAAAGVASKTITGALAGPVTMEATSAGLTTGTLGAFTVVHGAASQIARAEKTQQPEAPRRLTPELVKTEKLARMATDLTAAKLLVYRAAWEKDNGADRITMEAAMAKSYATEAAQRIVDDAVQIIGGRGVLMGGVGVFPGQEVVVVRLGSTDAGVDWQGWMRGVAARVSRGAR